MSITTNVTLLAIFTLIISSPLFWSQGLGQSADQHLLDSNGMRNELSCITTKSYC